MDRREFIKGMSLGALISISPSLAYASGDYRRLLVLVELKGGNDGLNTVIPFNDPNYTLLRPRLALRREEVVQLDGSSGLHPSLQPLWALWQDKELGIVQSVGYAQPNLSHFRSIEIWDTGSASNEYLQEGWLARVFAKTPAPARFIAEGVLLGSSELGPLTGSRAIALRDAEQFKRQSRLAREVAPEGNPALRHLLKVESDISQAGKQLESNFVFQTIFPSSDFGKTVQTACKVAASGEVAVLRLTLNGFDTHQNQPGTHANLLRDLAEGLLALRSALKELNRWQDSLIMTYSEFGRRPKANQSNGTDHGTVAPHFVLGGKVKGGLYGQPPVLDRLDGNGNLSHAVDFRSLYATVVQRWWGLPAIEWRNGPIRPLEFLRA